MSLDDTAPVKSITLNAHGALSNDADRGVVRIDPTDMAQLGVRAGDVVAIKGEATAFARCLPAPQRFREQSLILLDGALRSNSKVAIGDRVELSLAEAMPANTIKLGHDGARLSASAQANVLRSLENVPCKTGDKLRATLIGGRQVQLEVLASQPEGPVLPQPTTAMSFETSEKPERVGLSLSYEDLGGLSKQVERVREMVELPMRRPDLFERLGVDAPKGVLFTGPPGTGKTLLARAVAEECDASFFQIQGPEIVSKHYGDSEARIRKVFETAAAQAPAVIFIDEIDAIAPKRDSMAGDRQVERRIVAQLLTLLDGLSARGQVVVMAATNLPNSLDPALRRPGRFDREISFSPPDRNGRMEILQIHTRAMPLTEDVDLGDLASRTHGFVGADLAALSREAAMAALRRQINSSTGPVEAINSQSLTVNSEDFDNAIKEIAPSAVRETTFEVPEVLWSDVGGCETAKAALAEAVIWPLSKPAVFARLGLKPAKGVLMSGPPGCGKTMLAKALANEAKVNFISVRGPQLLNQYVGEAEKAVRELFSKARLAAPCIIFFDEIDALVPKRGGSDGAVMERIVAQMLTEIDGMEELKGVFLLAATNRPDRVDPAILRPGRFDLLIELPKPDREARSEIFHVHTRGTPLSRDVDLDELVSEAEGLVGADIEALCQGAARAALRRAILSETENEVRVERADFTKALQERRTSDSVRERKETGL